MKMKFFSVVTFITVLLMSGCFNHPSQCTIAESENTFQRGAPNLRITSIRHEAYVDGNGQCSVRFYCTVVNSGNAICYGYVLGMRGWTIENISTPSGYWCATNSVGRIDPGQSKEILCYGPGYVGSKVSQGTYLNITGYVDVYKSVSESNENDNARTQYMRMGY